VSGYSVEAVVCEGIPCLEINKKAVEINSDMIIMVVREIRGYENYLFRVAPPKGS